MIKSILDAYSSTINLCDTIIKNTSIKKQKKETKIKGLQEIILFQRNISCYTTKQYDPEEILNDEECIKNYLKTYYEIDLFKCFERESVNIYWSLRYKSSISNEAVEEFLEKFIKCCKDNGYEV